jgi:murein DD-endopeptidase MepM/ murein hydrolase activator NlpD
MRSYIFCIWICLLLFFGFAGCSSAGTGIFGGQILHDSYGEKLKNAGLQQTALGRLWFSEAEKALAQPQAISLPYQEFGFFSGEQPRAAGLSFTARRGAKLLFSLIKNPNKDFALFADLWQIDESGNPLFLKSIDTSQINFDYEINADGRYLLRLQPELLKSGDYTLSISVGPSLGAPVAGNKGKIGSIWDDPRDAGERRHEGVDLFAPFRTPVVAAAEGTITSVNENKLGGKVIFLKPGKKDFTLYYAHLDTQLVTEGQKVKSGDTLGLIGNTGNAKSTDPHLHFGIYTSGGAVNPLPFINQKTEEPEKMVIAASKLKGWFRPDKAENISVYGSTFILKANTLLKPVAVSSKNYRMELPNGTIIQIPTGSVQPAERPVYQATLMNSCFLFAFPDMDSPRKLQLLPSTSVNVHGVFNDFAFVTIQQNSGWLPLSGLN